MHSILILFIQQTPSVSWFLWCISITNTVPDVYDVMSSVSGGPKARPPWALARAARWAEGHMHRSGQKKCHGCMFRMASQCTQQAQSNLSINGHSYCCPGSKNFLGPLLSSVNELLGPLWSRFEKWWWSHAGKALHHSQGCTVVLFLIRMHSCVKLAVKWGLGLFPPFNRTETRKCTIARNCCSTSTRNCSTKKKSTRNCCRVYSNQQQIQGDSTTWYYPLHNGNS